MSVPEHDFEALAVTLLKASADVTDLVPAEWISTKLARAWDANQIALRVTRIGGLPVEDVVGHLARARLQIDAFAPTELAAFAAASTALAVLRTDGPGAHPGVVVTHVGQDLPLRSTDDPDSDAERYVFGAVFYGHAAA